MPEATRAASADAAATDFEGASEPCLVLRRSGGRTVFIKSSAQRAAGAQRTVDADAQRRVQVCVRNLVPGVPAVDVRNDPTIAAAQVPLFRDSMRTSRRTMRRNASSCGSSSAPSTLFSFHNARQAADSEKKALSDLYVPNWVETLMCCGIVMMPFILLGMLVAPVLFEAELCM